MEYYTANIYIYLQCLASGYASFMDAHGKLDLMSVVNADANE